MATFGLIEYQDASNEVRAIYDDIMATRKTDWINNFWKAIAHDPILLKRTWESIKQIMAPGTLDPLTKELIYIAVSVTNNCNYCIAGQRNQQARHWLSGRSRPAFPASSSAIILSSAPVSNCHSQRLAHSEILACPCGQVLLPHRSTHVLWLALSSKAEHIDVTGEPCFERGVSESLAS